MNAFVRGRLGSVSRCTVAPALCAALAASCLLAFAAAARADDTSLCDPQVKTCRKIEVANNCAQDVWVAVQGNAIYCDDADDCDGTCDTNTNTCTIGGAACTLDVQCPGTCNTTNNTCTCTPSSGCAPEGQICDTTTSTAQCEWARPMNGGWHLASGSSDAIYVPNKKGKSQSISWAGRFWGRTGCPDFSTCGQPGTVCAQDSDCCTNAGCEGLFTCSDATQCNSWACTTNADCGIGTCNQTTSRCEECVSGSCGCRTNTDCQGGGLCQSGTCVGQCEANGVACQTGDCLGVLECAIGVGGKAPFTLAEVAMVWGRRKDANAYDTYDVSQVDGFNVAVEVAPTTNIYKKPKSISPQPWCGKPGCADGSECASLNTACSFDPTDFTSCLCTWDTDASSCPTGMQAVSPITCSTNADCGTGTCNTATVPPTCTCTSNGDCPGSGPTCGLYANATANQVCGTYVGCLNPNNACTIDSTLNAGSVDCPTWGTLYACTSAGAGSCYSAGADSSCCGCPEWSPGGNTSLPVTNGCQSTNSNWTTNVQPLVENFKDSCPTAYSFQYDDPTSTFNCASKGPRKPLEYTITFCPTGSPGALP